MGRTRKDPDLASLSRALNKLQKQDRKNWPLQLGKIGKWVQEWRQAIIDDLGGDDEVSAMERMVIDFIVKNWLKIEFCDQYILNPRDQRIVDFDRDEMRPIVLQVRQLQDSVERYLRDLGLKRRRVPKPISEILERMGIDPEHGVDRGALGVARVDPADGAPSEQPAPEVTPEVIPEDDPRGHPRG